MEKINQAILPPDIPLYKQNNKHIKNLIHDIGNSLPTETNCRKIVLQLCANELQRIRNAVHDKSIFLVVDESTQSGTQYIKIDIHTIFKYFIWKLGDS